ncbi:ArsR/SmtB family transcription factor [Nocardia bovistercoris]|uniref:Winged helix-turn-helix transcriptional regulator n=1 Tax=Nocardia bovistercoris TaxID=2785916 RepID=A0A931IIX4_9NOCA|nr:metalloregulator ArsR/SmtB family transcription factor [Nocardia bovistercoris]MBH0781155.1 winged helix-turn-helix transcriptional regulator [Nocardia bovistercoris]
MDASAAKIFEALGDPVRRGILEIVASGELSAGAVVDAVRAITPISQPAVSQHLKVLRDAGLLQVRAEGTRRIHAIDPAGVDLAASWLARLSHPIEQFAQPLDALATEIARGQRARRAEQSPAGVDDDEYGRRSG